MPPNEKKRKPRTAPGNDPATGFETEQLTQPRRAGSDDDLLH